MPEVSLIHICQYHLGNISIYLPLTDNSHLIFIINVYESRSAYGFMHMRIRRNAIDRNIQLSDFNRRFITIPEMVHHYTRNRLPIKGAEHMCLKTPILMQLL